MFKAKIQPKRLITVGGTLFCAWGIGYLMQSNAPEAMPQESGVNAPPVEIEPLSQLDEVPLKISDIRLTSAILAPMAPEPASVFLPDAPVMLASLSDEYPSLTLPTEEAAPTFACEHRLSAEPAAAAMVTLSLDAPCMANDRFTVHHNGMMFSDVTDENGKRSFSVPALSADAVFIVSFPNGDGVVAKTAVTSLEYYDRVVVQWAGDSGVQIHALEFGADYHQPGHVWAGDMRDISTAALGEGGFITRLGATDLHEGRMAEIYTFPSGTSARDGAVRLSLEAEITPANCGRDIEAQSIQLGSVGAPKVQDVVLAMPDCDAVGDFLVLKNLLNDLKIARN